MNEQLKEFVTAIGALAELLGLLRVELRKNGFSQAETMELLTAFMLEQFKKKNQEEN